MEKIGVDVRRELGRFGPTGGMGELLKVWGAAAGETIARNAIPARIARDGTVHVTVSSSAWAFELAQLETELAARLQHLLGEDAPRRLRFAPGRLPEPGAESVPKVQNESAAPSEAEWAEAARIAAAISDSELRELVSRAAAASLAAASRVR
jgi:hypothetical protein